MDHSAVLQVNNLKKTFPKKRIVVLVLSIILGKNLYPMKSLVDSVPLPTELSYDAVKKYIDAGGDPQQNYESGSTLLHAAALNGKPLVLLYLLEKDFAVETRDKNGLTALHAAAEKGHLGCMSILLERGARIDEKDNIYEITPMSLAVMSGSLSGLAYLLDKGANIEARDKNGYTALHGVIEKRQPKCVRALLDKGADIEAKLPPLDRTPLLIAAALGNYKCLDLLLEKGANSKVSDNSGISALQYALFNLAQDSTNEEFQACFNFLQKGEDISSRQNLLTNLNNGTDLMYKAMGLYSTEDMKLLLEKDSARKGDLLVSADADNGGTKLVKSSLESSSIKALDEDSFTPLHAAAFSGDAECVDTLITQGANIEARGPAEVDMTPLYVAVMFGHDSCVSHLIKAGANKTTCGPDGFTALEMASLQGHVGCMEVLLGNGANIDRAHPEFKMTPLMLAIINGKFEGASFLIQQGADAKLKGTLGITPLHCAARAGDIKCIKLLLEKGADINQPATESPIAGVTPLFFAAGQENSECLNFLLSNGAQKEVGTANGVTPLMVAINCGCIGQVKVLLDHEADVHASVSESEYTPLHVACEVGMADCIAPLLRAGADKNATARNGETPIFVAACLGHPECISSLLDEGADPNIKDNYENIPLVIAICLNNSDCASLLLERGADVNLSNKLNATPLSVAAERGNYTLVELLLSHGVNLDVQLTDGRTALYMALEKDHFDSASLLIKRGADVTICDKLGWTPLHCAARKGNIALVKALLAKGADLEAKDLADEKSEQVGGRTPLFYAAQGGHFDCVSLLLDRGAAADVLDKVGCTPLISALKSGNFDCIRAFCLKEKSFSGDRQKDGVDFLVNLIKTNGTKSILKAAQMSSMMLAPSFEELYAPLSRILTAKRVLKKLGIRFLPFRRIIFVDEDLSNDLIQILLYGVTRGTMLHWVYEELKDMFSMAQDKTVIYLHDHLKELLELCLEHSEDDTIKEVPFILDDNASLLKDIIKKGFDERFSQLKPVGQKQKT